MDDKSSAIARAHPYARLLLQSAVLGISALLLTLYVPPLQFMVAPAITLLPILLIVAIVLSAKLFRLGDDELPLFAFLIGAIYVVGGIALDVFATASRSPLLEREANPIARALMSMGTSLPNVYAYGMATQTLLAVLILTLWGAFLKHRRALIESVSGGEFKSSIEFCKAATGGAHLSWRQFLFPIRKSELPNAYHFLWLATAIAVGGTTYRWFLGLEWLGVAFMTRYSVLLLSVGLSLLGYFLWLRHRFFESRAA